VLFLYFFSFGPVMANQSVGELTPIIIPGGATPQAGSV